MQALSRARRDSAAAPSEILFLLVAIACLIVPATSLADTVNVSSVAELEAAVSGGNSQGGNRTILLADGIYTLGTGLYINAPGITIAGESENRDAVVIEGDAMNPSASVGNVITVAASNFTLEHVTLQIQVRGEKDADSTIIRDCVLRDGYEQLVKVSVDVNNTSVSGDNGLVENCVFEYSAGIGPQYYIGGIDAHAAKGWVVRNNRFEDIISPDTTVAEYAIHFWNDSGDNLVENNLIINCDRGIGFGLNSRGNTGGTIRNNMIYHADNKGAFADTGISIHNSPLTVVAHNTIHMEHGYPTAIEYRFDGTRDVQIVNNLTNKSISAQSGGSGSEQTNLEDARPDWFVNVATGDLHLASAVPEVVDQGTTLGSLIQDYDNEVRPQGAGYDIGADEFSSTVAVRPAPPTNLTAN